MFYYCVSPSSSMPLKGLMLINCQILPILHSAQFQVINRNLLNVCYGGLLVQEYHSCFGYKRSQVQIPDGSQINSLWFIYFGAPQVGISGKESACQCRRHQRHGFDPWVGKIPCRRAWPPTPIFLPGESHGQRSLGRGGTIHSVTKNQTRLK